LNFSKRYLHSVIFPVSTKEIVGSIPVPAIKTFNLFGYGLSKALILPNILAFLSRYKVKSVKAVAFPLGISSLVLTKSAPFQVVSELPSMCLKDFPSLSLISFF
jgi:hypothetical protein